MLPDAIPCQGPSITAVFWSGIHNLNLMVRKHLKTPSEKILLKIGERELVFFKNVNSIKDKERLCKMFQIKGDS